MEAENWETADDLIAAFDQKNRSFSFFKIVQLIESFYSKRAKVGERGPAQDEVVRFHHSPSFAFPSSDVETIEKSADNRFIKITTNFLGLTGSGSPLPSFYTEDILWSSNAGEDIINVLLDIFHHRLISFLYRAWSKYRYFVRYERQGRDKISQQVFSLAGFGTEHIFDSLKMSPVRLLPYAGILSQKPATASGLRKILSDYLSCPELEITQCVGRWLYFGKDQQVSLGKRNCTLGESFTIGQRVYDTSGKFRITIGPIGYEKFKSLMPDTKDFSEMRDIINLYFTDRFDFETELILKYEEIPAFKLTSESPPVLGWTAVFKPDTERNLSLVV
ncbi:MAG: type VI secretion system baseplate subunit TssG [Nitrospirae bacterium]|nr:type VI secretion system baseplate subunit TssG [Nitrospirota bacterium]